MKGTQTIKINFHGGIISPGELYSILLAASDSGLYEVSFGLRQQLLLSVPIQYVEKFTREMKKLEVFYETDADNFPNIISSYPAEEIFIHNTWLSEGVYKDILDGIEYQPTLKINISDSNQSFTPMLTGNINWVASSTSQHFWHLFIRFPKTNIIYEWDELVYTNDIPKISLEIETLILANKDLFYDNRNIKGEQLFSLVDKNRYILKSSANPAFLPHFNLPYYEGLNRYNNNKYWLGVYRREELFDIGFLKELCQLCLNTKIGQICSTPWKSLIVKGIDEKDKIKWNILLEKHRVNMRHAANELNFQVEDNCVQGLELKKWLVTQLNNDDTRTFGICIGIKTRRKSEVFSSILVRRKPLVRIFSIGFLHVYDILCAKDFNPNARTGNIYSRNNPKFLLFEQLRRCIISYYESRSRSVIIPEQRTPVKDTIKNPGTADVFQCKHCLTVYDELTGDVANGIEPGTSFESLPVEYTCPLCEAPKTDLKAISRSLLGLQAI